MENFDIIDSDLIIVNQDEQNLLDKIKTNKDTFILLSDSKKTENLCIQVVHYDGLLLEHIKNKTPKIINTAIQNNADALKFLNVDEQLPCYCELAINKNGLALEHIKDQTDKAYICILAIENSPSAIQFVHHQTFDICLQTIQKSPEMIKHVRIKDQRLYNEAVRLLGSTIEHVPTKYQIEDLCIDALNYSGLNLQFIENQTPKLCQIALNNTIESCKYIKSYLQIIYNNSELEVKYKDNIKVMVHDYSNKKTYYKNYDKTLLNIIFTFIENDRGDKGLNNTKKIFSINKTDIEKIRLDNNINEGLFIIQTDMNKYDIYEKKTSVTKIPGYVIDSIYVVPSVNLVRTYGLMEYLVE